MNCPALFKSVSIGALLLICQACQPSPSPTPADSAPPNSPNSPESLESSESIDSNLPSLIDAAANPDGTVDPLTAPSLTVATGDPLPLLSRDELTTLTSEGKTLGQSWIDLSGLGKIIPPPPFTEALKTYRREALSSQPTIAPFLGTWHDDGSISRVYYLSIFPAKAADQVCVLEYRAGQQVVEEIVTGPIFTLSLATVTEGELRSPTVRTTQATARQVELASGDKAALLDVFNADNGVYSFGLQGLPALPPGTTPTMKEELSQGLDTLACTREVLTAVADDAQF